MNREFTPGALEWKVSTVQVVPRTTCEIEMENNWTYN